MNILYVGLRVPYPPDRGDRIRSYHFVKHLAARHAVHLVCFGDPDADAANVEHLKTLCARVECVRLPRHRSYLNSALNVFSGRPLQIHYWHAGAMQRAVDRLAESVRFDLVHVQLFRMAQYVGRLGHLPRVLDLTDAMGLNLDRRAAVERGMKRPLVMLERHRARRYEIEVARAFDWNLVTSQGDRDYLLRQDASLKVSVIPVGIDTDHFRPAPASSRPHLVFMGTMDYFPNVDGAIYFCNEILPLVRKAHPEVVLYILGRCPPPRVRQLGDREGVVVTGRVPDIRPYLQDAAVFVSPLRSGSGIQVKNLEAMAMGLPVVSTSMGAAGLEAAAGREILLADSPGAFADLIVELLRSPELGRSVGQAARRLMERRYDWRVVARSLDEVYARVLAARTGRESAEPTTGAGGAGGPGSPAAGPAG